MNLAGSPRLDGPTWPWAWEAGLMLLAAAVRLAFLYEPLMNGDLAMVGLMGMHVLEGDWQAFLWGTEYGGTLVTFLVAGSFALLGVGPRSLNLPPCLVSLVMVWLVYLIARRLWGRRAGLVALGLTAVGPYFLIWWSVMAMGVHVEMLPLAALVLWLTLRILEARPGSRGHRWLCLAWGLAAGLGLWTSLLIVYFLLPASLVLWRCDPRLVLRPAFAAMVGGFILGGLPLWWHNLASGWGTLSFLAGHREEGGGLASNLAYALTQGFPVLMGAREYQHQGWMLPLLGPLALGAALWAAAVGLVRWAGDLGRLARRGAAAGNGAIGGGLLLLCLVSILLLNAASALGGSRYHRYLLSLNLVWPLLVAAAWAAWFGAGGWRRRVALVAVVILGLSNLAGTLKTHALLIPGLMGERRAIRANLEAMNRAFLEKGVGHVYVDSYWVGMPATFYARERVIYTRPYAQARPQYTRALLRARSWGLANQAPGSEEVSALLHSLGMGFAQGRVGAYALFWGLTPPPPARTGAPSGLAGLGGTHPGEAPWAADLSAATRWSPGQAQRPGQALRVDLGAEVPALAGLLLLGGALNDHPRGLAVATSRDGRVWTPALEVGRIAHPGWVSGGKLVITPGAAWQEVRFPPRPARYLRLTLAGSADPWWWSLVELLVLEDDPAAAWDPAAAAAWLVDQAPGGGAILAEPALEAWLPPERSPAWPTRERPAWLAPVLEPRLVIPPQGTRSFGLRPSLAPAGRRVLEECGWEVTSREGPGVVLLRATAPAGNALEGQVAVEWVARGGGQEADLGRERPVAGLAWEGPVAARVRAGEVQLSVSGDGRTWRRLDLRPRRSAELYWTHLIPLAARGDRMGLVGPPVPARYLRLEGPSPAPPRVITRD